MVRFRVSWRVLAALLAAGVFLQSASCGALIHPDRVGQPHRGRLDTSIVLLDALGLLFFFVPGVIAFVVDFATGAIYLPAHECVGMNDAERDGDYVVVRVPPESLSRERVEQILQERTGRRVRLDPGSYEARALKQLDEFKTQTEALAHRRQPVAGAEVLFRAQSR